MKEALWALAFIVCLMSSIVCGMLFLFCISTLGDGDALFKLVAAPLLLAGVVGGWVGASDCFGR